MEKEGKRQMKNVRVIVCILVILSMVFVTGCKTAKAPDESDDAVVFDSSPVSSSLVHGFSSGLWFVISTAIAECLSNSYEGSLLQATPGESTANIYRLEEYTSEFGMTHSSNLYAAINGIGQFEEKFNNVSGIAVFYPSAAQLVVKKDIGAASFADFIENKIPIDIAIGVETSVANIAFRNILGEYDLTIQNLEDWGCKIHFKNMSDSEDMFNDGIIDGIFVLAGAPTKVIVSMETNADMTMLNIDKEIVDSVIEKYGYVAYTIPEGVYSFSDAAVPSFVTFSMIAASLQTPDETAYKMAKSLHENLEYLKTVHGTLKGISPEMLIQKTGVPLHPGAEKYYKEVGLID
jgi:TRAP transporter TAXI family solute receptor